ncbi:MAG: tRNA uridine-5-carboxymethylaminomethyl(34) synthesis enzyme MnmG, partial [Prevotella sp.]|nr:tRNA uridine-5-carboxymethylaminomethyl(34) synthesis enzyme MnmG [Prevotella sp.]
VWSPRALCYLDIFIWKWRETLDGIDGLDIWQDQVEELLVEPSDKDFRGVAVGVRTVWGVEFRAKSIVVTAGTFLNGLLHVGRRMVPGGRMAEPAVTRFTESITRWGIRADRMKTGTPVRIDRRSVDFSLLEEQPGENDFHQFSYLEMPKNDAEIAEKSAKIDARTLPQLSCWLLNTNARVHEILRTGLDDSPLYNGQIQSIGPRYCPSIETKLVTFPDREQHPLFLEPEGIDTNEMYLNGFSSSMPIDIQLEALRQIPVLRDVKIYRPGYAIEYDFFDPTQLNHSMESKILSGLFFAGQVNGTTGYEEAAGQGLMAGVNAAFHSQSTPNTSHSTLHTPHLTLARDEAYIGVLIDDLVTKGVDEPYRMFTSRAEYRILLRQDDADARLTERSYELGLASRERYDWWLEKKENIEKIVHFCENTPVKPREINGALENLGTTPLQFGCKIADLIARPQLSIAKLAEVIPELKNAILSPKNRQEEIAEAAEIRIKYKGYIEREKLVADKMRRLENIRIKDRFKYSELHEISTEARQKLERINPETLAQASRIPGVSPSDINVLLVLLGR